MLKKIRLLFLGFIVLAGSACVTPTHASSAQPVLITYVQAAGPTGAKEELVVLYNNGPTAIDITNWCIANKTAAFLCIVFTDEDGKPVHFVMPAYTYVTIASREYLAAHSLPDTAVTLLYDVTSQSSGSIVNSADTVSLLNTQGEVVNSRAWTTAPASGKGWARLKLLSSPDVYAVASDTSDWSAAPWLLTPPLHSVEIFIEPPVDTPDIPDTPDPQPEQHDEEMLPVLISEVLPNAAGSDVGKEYIEIYNPDSTHAQSLNGVRLRVGLESPKWYTFPSGITLPAGGYVTFTDEELGFTLVNTSGGVQLYRGDVAMGDRVEYTSPKDDAAWALIDGLWQYTAPTPGTRNVAAIITAVADVTDETQPKPCASNQYRNLETGRCRLIATATSTPTPCKEGQERSAETNRCRTIVAATTPAPCKEGQERNLETNRCRNIVKMSSVGYDVKGVQTKASTQMAWYYWAAIVAIVALIIGYAVWEWRQELGGLWKRARTSFAKK